MRPGGGDAAWIPPAREDRLLFSKHAEVSLSSGSAGNFDQSASSPTFQDIRDPIVRVPALQQQQWKVRVLQRWTGRVQRIENGMFVAELTDTMNPGNPIEEVELDTSEVSAGDLPLLEEGAIFYWTIGYRDSAGGQRSRVSTLRFARLPVLTKSAVARAFAEADLVAASLECE